MVAMTIEDRDRGNGRWKTRVWVARLCHASEKIKMVKQSI